MGWDSPETGERRLRACAHPVEKDFTQTPSLVITEGRRFSFLPGFFGFLWFSFGFWFSFRFSFDFCLKPSETLDSLGKPFTNLRKTRRKLEGNSKNMADSRSRRQELVEPEACAI